MSAAYWERRAEELMDRAQRDAKQTAKAVGQAHASAQRDIQGAVDRIYRNFAKKYGMDVSKAATFLAEPCTKAEYDDLLKQIATMPAGRARTALEAKAASGAYAYRIRREEALSDTVHAVSVRLAGEEQSIVSAHLASTLQKQTSMSVYNLQRRTGWGYAWAGVDDATIRRIINEPWSGQSFSARIWQNQAELEKQLNDVISSGFLTGASKSRMAQDLAERMGVSLSRARTLINTETTHVAAQGDMLAYESAEVEKYQFLATLDMRTSKACQDLDGEVFAVKDAKTGVNLPPMHPHCRSTTLAVFDDEDMEGKTRAARDPITGEVVKVPRDMTYKEWQKLQEEHYGKERMDAARKMAVNRERDKAQYNNYVQVLGKKNMPASFAQFQQTKYLDASEYGVLKAQMRGMTYYDKAIANEPSITAQVKANAQTLGVECGGLDYRIKSKESYLRKIRLKYNPDGNTYEINDVLRYTYLDSADKLSKSTLESIDLYASQGYNTIKVDNTWTIPRATYFGVNTLVESPDGQKFEVQYHTPESFALKNGELHKLYERRRVIDPESYEAFEIDEQMREMSAALTKPTNIEKMWREH